MKGRFVEHLAIIFRSGEINAFTKLVDQCLGVALAVSALACGGGNKGSSVPEPAPGATKIDPATAGESTASVSFDGVAPRTNDQDERRSGVCQENKTQMSPAVAGSILVAPGPAPARSILVPASARQRRHRQRPLPGH